MAMAGHIRAWSVWAGRVIRGLAPVEARLQAAGPWLWFAVAAAVVGYCGLPLSDHPDTLRDLLAARDCTDRGDCAAEGATASFAGLHNGALWPFLLVLLRTLHLPTPAIWWLVLAADAAAVALVFVAVRRSAPTMAASAAALAIAVLVAERTPNTVWSPALAPWLTALMIAWWLHWRASAPAHPWGPLVHGGLLALLADSHPATWTCASGWLAAIVLVDPRPFAAISWTLAAFVAATGLLAPQTQFDNLLHLGALVPLGWVAPLAMLALPAVRRVLPSGWKANPSAGLLAVTVLSGAALVAGMFALDRPLEPRYLTPTLLVAVAAIATAPWPLPSRLLPANLPLAVLAMLAGLMAGPGQVSMGHTWPVVAQVQRALQAADLAYPVTTTRVQGYGCMRLAAAVEVDARGHPWQDRANSPIGVQVLDLPIGQAAPAGWQRLTARRNLATWWRTVPLWVDPSRGEACLTTATTRRCTAVTPGLWLSPSGAPAVRPGAPLHARAMPESIALSADPSAAAVLAVTLPVQSGTQGTRTVFLLDNDARCPWTIARADHPGAQPAADRRSILLPAAGTETSLTLAKSIGPNCSHWAGTTANPPCMLELDDPALRPEVP